MSELWVRWRIALVALGLALGLIGVVWAITAGGPATVAPSSSVAISATPAAPPPATVPTPAPPPPASAPSSAAPAAPVAPSAGPTDSASAPTIVWRPVVRKADLVAQRSEAVKLLETTEDQLKRARRSRRVRAPREQGTGGAQAARHRAAREGRRGREAHDRRPRRLDRRRRPLSAGGMLAIAGMIAGVVVWKGRKNKAG